ncbi:MAG: response regulator [Actinomycetaceae bacterium]|nr:response regulator [Actinomycetaceae bacterium]
MKALVVDDSKAMRRIVGGILKKQGFEICEAADGKEAFDLLTDPETGPVTLACIDWNMPVMNGLELVVAIRGRRDLRNISLMMVTTETEHSQIVRALAAGAHEYLIKPFTPDGLKEKLILLGLNPEGTS